MMILVKQGSPDWASARGKHSISVTGKSLLGADYIFRRKEKGDHQLAPFDSQGAKKLYNAPAARRQKMCGLLPGIFALLCY